MADQKTAARWKIPFLDLFIVKGIELRRSEDRFEILERQFKRQLISSEITVRLIEKQLHQISVMQGRLRAPECPKCGKPKTAGGIQWLDHAECKRRRGEKALAASERHMTIENSQ